MGGYKDERDSYKIRSIHIQGGDQYMNRGCTHRRPMDLQPCHNARETHTVGSESNQQSCRC
jgi:hypothetical protein